MNLFGMEFVDIGQGSEKESRTWEFKHRILAPLALVFILPTALIIAGIHNFFIRRQNDD